MALRAWLLQRVEESSATFVPAFQQACGVRPVPQKEHADAGAYLFNDPQQPLLRRAFYAVLFAIFHTASAFGSEPFIIFFFPLVFWCINTELGRCIVFIWAFGMYLGQLLKDYFELPRPSICNRAVRPVCMEWVLEYGFPSTHTTSIISQSMSIAAFAVRDSDSTSSIAIAAAIAVLISVATAYSRIYMGVHSGPDLVGGAIIGVLLGTLSLFTRHLLDHYVQTNDHVLFMAPLVTMLLIFASSKAASSVVTFRDTTTIVSVACGVAMGSYVSHQWGFRADALGAFKGSTFDFCKLFAIRTLLGFAVMLSIREICKRVVTSLLLKLFGEESDSKPKDRYEIAGPTYFLTYTSVAYAAVVIVPMMLGVLGLDPSEGGMPFASTNLE